MVNPNQILFYVIESISCIGVTILRIDLTRLFSVSYDIDGNCIDMQLVEGLVLRVSISLICMSGALAQLSHLGLQTQELTCDFSIMGHPGWQLWISYVMPQRSKSKTSRKETNTPGPFMTLLGSHFHRNLLDWSKQSQTWQDSRAEATEQF
jgi:hypothetical protein